MVACKVAFKGELDLKFLETQDFESFEDMPIERQAPIIGRNIVRLLMMGWLDSWTQLITWPIFNAVFFERNPLLLRGLRLAFQHGFETLFTQLQGKKLTQEQIEQVQLYLSNCLSVLPIADLTPYESVKIPQLIKEHWIMVDYHVHPIELTTATDIQQDQDRVFAYGLEPISNQEAEAHLIFMGTTYPAGQGFIPQIDTDFKGFDTVGHSLYQSGKKNVEQWLLRQKRSVHVCGLSLGGSLSLLLAIDMGNYVSRVDALNPAGLHDHWYTNPDDKWADLIVKPQVVVQLQGNDPVSLLGVWKSEWDIIHVTPPKEKQGPISFCDHFLNYAGFKGTHFAYVSADEENVKRRYRNFWIYSIARSFIYYGAVIPYSYAVRPLAYFFRDQWRDIVVAILGFVAMSAMLVWIAAKVMLLVGIATTLGAISSLIFRKKDSVLPLIELLRHAQLHDAQQPRNPDLDIYNPDKRVEIELSQAEIRTYYQVMRCLVKKKDFLPADSKLMKHGVLSSKRALLLATSNPENKEAHVTFTSTKAKAVQIKHTLTLVHQLGIENKEALREAVADEYQRYCNGKPKSF